MPRHFEQELRHMEERFLEMGALVQRAVHGSVESLRTMNQDTAMDVIDRIEPEVNRFHWEIDQLGFEALSLRQPVAGDLRFIMAMMKNNHDLERMGDRSVHIALRVISMLTLPSPRSITSVFTIGEAVEALAADALDAFARRDDLFARQILQREDALDRERDAVFSELMVEINTHPALLQQGVDLILISRNLKRIGGHATNIADSVISLVLGRDTRRQPEPWTPEHTG